MRRAHWDEEREVWVLERLSDANKRDTAAMQRPVSALGYRRPMSSFARSATLAGDMNPRFRSDNILNLELDMPERTTYDYEGPGMDPRVQAAINAAFADDGELLFVGSETDSGRQEVAGGPEGARGQRQQQQQQAGRPDSAAQRRARPPSARARAPSAGPGR